ncbi:MAG: glycosyltransferase family 4 protein [bacterium]|nr:glycosyltransferase family 4 protein [bacterium]
MPQENKPDERISLLLARLPSTNGSAPLSGWLKDLSRVATGWGCLLQTVDRLGPDGLPSPQCVLMRSPVSQKPIDEWTLHDWQRHPAVHLFACVPRDERTRSPRIWRWLSLMRRGTGKRRATTIAVCTSRFVKRQLMASGYTAERVRIIPPGIALEDSPSEPRPHAFAAPMRVLVAGSQPTELGVAIEAAALIVEAKGSGSLSVTLATPSLPREVEVPSDLAGLVARSAPAKSASDRRDCYADHDLLVALDDGCGLNALTVLESMAAGLPVLCASSCAGADLVQDGVTGHLFDASRPKQFANRISRLANDPVRTARMARDARKRVEECFTLDRLARDLLDLLPCSEQVHSPRRTQQ